MSGKLNVFQRTMLQWNEMQPYNAVHVLKIPEPFDRERLEVTIGRELQSLGLTGLKIDKRRGRFEYRGGPVQIRLKVLEGGAEAEKTLESEMQEQLNTVFPDHGEIDPFRFFAVLGESGFYLGLTYFHVVAGAESILLLMKHLAGRYLGASWPAFCLPLHLYPRRYGAYFRRHPLVFLRALLQVLGAVLAMRQVLRPRYREIKNPKMGLSLFSLSRETLERLLQTAKSWNVTVNDLFFALLMKSLSPLAAKRFSAPKRKQMALGTVVNIRRDLEIDPRKNFGLFLGSFVVTHPVPEAIDLGSLVQEVHQQTARVKQQRSYFRTPIDLWLGRAFLSWSSGGGRYRFYPKVYPLWGGITNVNLNLLWPEGGETRPLDYFRAVSTGPLTPLVFSATTVRDRLNVGLTYREAAYSRAEIERLISDFRQFTEMLEVGL